MKFCLFEVFGAAEGDENGRGGPPLILPRKCQYVRERKGELRGTPKENPSECAFISERQKIGEQSNSCAKNAKTPLLDQLFLYASCFLCVPFSVRWRWPVRYLQKALSRSMHPLARERRRRRWMPNWNITDPFLPPFSWPPRAGRSRVLWK